MIEPVYSLVGNTLSSGLSSMAAGGRGEEYGSLLNCMARQEKKHWQWKCNANSREVERPWPT